MDLLKEQFIDASMLDFLQIEIGKQIEVICACLDKKHVLSITVFVATCFLIREI